MALNAARSDKKEDGEDNQSDRDDKLEYVIGWWYYLVVLVTFLLTYFFSLPN